MTTTMKNIRPRLDQIGVGGEYQCKSDAFSHKLSIRIEKMYKNSVLAQIIDCHPEDKFVAATKGNKTIIAKENIWFLLKEPDIEEIEIKPKKVKGTGLDLTKKKTSSNKNTSARGCVVIMPNGEREEFYSIKSAMRILGVTSRTITRSIEENKKVKLGKMKGCQFYFVSQEGE